MDIFLIVAFFVWYLTISSFTFGFMILPDTAGGQPANAWYAAVQSILWPIFVCMEGMLFLRARIQNRNPYASDSDGCGDADCWECGDPVPGWVSESDDDECWCGMCEVEEKYVN